MLYYRSTFDVLGERIAGSPALTINEKEEKEKDLNSLRQTIQALKRLFSTELKTL